VKWKIGCDNCPNLWEATHSFFFDNTKHFWNLYKRIYKDFEDYLSIICVSDWLKDRAVQSPFFSKIAISVIENVIDTISTYHSYNVSNLRSKYGIKDETVLLHVTPSFKSAIKGGSYVLELIKRLPKHDYKFFIIGYDVENLELPDNVITIKKVSDPKLLAQYYSLANMTIMNYKY
jgi:hypothetical protein